MRYKEKRWKIKSNWVNYFQFRQKSARNSTKTLYLYRSSCTFQLIYWLRRAKKKNSECERRKERKILCSDDDADGTWVYKNNNTNYSFSNSFSFFSSSFLFIFLVFAFEIALLFPLHSTPYNVCGFSSLHSRTCRLLRQAFWELFGGY